MVALIDTGGLGGGLVCEKPASFQHSASVSLSCLWQRGTYYWVEPSKIAAFADQTRAGYRLFLSDATWYFLKLGLY